MSIIRKQRRQIQFEDLEARRCLSSVGWDGPGQGGAELTYYVGNAPASVGQQAFETAIEEALAAWSDVVDVQFTQTNTPNLTDSLDFEFARLDGQNGTLAQAYFPDDVNRARIAGDVQFDIAESWELGNARGRAAFDLTLVAAHEIGHAIGIDHIATGEAVLNASVSSRESFSGLTARDIDAALSLYAPALSPQLSLPDEIEPVPESRLQPSDPIAEIPTVEPRVQYRWFGWRVWQWSRWTWNRIQIQWYNPSDLSPSSTQQELPTQTRWWAFTSR